MADFKHLDGGEPFLQPEKPFLLIYTDDRDEELSVAWLESEEDLRETVEEIKSYGCKVVDAIEIGSYREVNVK